MTKRLAGAFTLVAALWATGCDKSGDGSAPKAETKGVQFKELPPPPSPANGGGKTQQPGPAANAE